MFLSFTRYVKREILKVKMFCCVGVLDFNGVSNYRSSHARYISISFSRIRIKRNSQLCSEEQMKIERQAAAVKEESPFEC